MNVVVPGSIAYYLIEDGKITEEQLKDALESQKESKNLIGVELVARGFCTELDIAKAMEKKTGYKFVSIEEVGINFAIANIISPDLMAKRGILPLYQDEKRLFVVMRNPNDVVTRDNLSVRTGGMDIAERRIPQDGRTTVKVDDRTFDIRIAVLPSVYGEKIVMRLLERGAKSVQLKDIKFSKAQADRFMKTIFMPYGFLLVTGPTGSGKSTTLYATLAEVSDITKHTITLEDPVERRMPGICQVQMNTRAGMTFAAALRSVLRADPDIVMVGEIRDGETAKIAVESALTGHMVFSTLHTNDAPSAVTRLDEMGVEPFLTASSLVGVLAQRLVRVLCPRCKEAVDVTYRELRNSMEDFPIPEGKTLDDTVTIYQAKGCISCSNTGYKGRQGVFEFLQITPEMKNLILKRSGVQEIKDLAISQGMHTLRQEGIDKILEGTTSVEEVLRVIV